MNLESSRIQGLILILVSVLALVAFLPEAPDALQCQQRDVKCVSQGKILMFCYGPSRH